MRRYVLAALALIAFAPPAAAEQVRFRGTFTVTETKNCVARYFGETFSSAFRPAGIGDNPDITSLTQLNQFSADVYELPGATFPLKTWTPVKAHGIDNLYYTFNARIRITRQVPANITPRTGYVQLAGQIERMGNDPGSGGVCVASFRGAYFRRVEY